MQIEHFTKSQGGCKEWLGIVRKVEPSSDGGRRITFAFNKFKGDAMHEQTYVAKPGSSAYEHAAVNQLFKMGLDADGRICATPMTYLMCKDVRSPHSVCRFGQYPPPGCTEVTGTVVAVRAESANAKSLTFRYVHLGKTYESLYTAAKGAVGFDATVGSTYKIKVNSYGSVCKEAISVVRRVPAGGGSEKPSPTPSPTPSPSPSPDPRTGPCAKTTPGDALVLKKRRNGNKCSLDFVYLSKNREIRQSTGEDNMFCPALEGKTYQFNRSTSNNEFCSMRRPLVAGSAVCGTQNVKPHNLPLAKYCPVVPGPPRKTNSPDTSAPDTNPPDTRPPASMIMITEAPRFTAGGDISDAYNDKSQRVVGDGNVLGDSNVTNNYGGGGGAGGINLNLTVDNQNKSESTARGGAGGPRYGYGVPYLGGPHWLPTGVYGPSFILPPEKHVVAVPGDSFVLNPQGTVYTYPDGTVVGQTEPPMTTTPTAEPTTSPVLDTDPPVVYDDPIEDATYMPQPQPLPPAPTQPPKKRSNLMWYVLIAVCVLILAAAAFYYWKKRKGRASSSPLFL